MKGVPNKGNSDRLSKNNKGRKELITELDDIRMRNKAMKINDAPHFNAQNPDFIAPLCQEWFLLRINDLLYNR